MCPSNETLGRIGNILFLTNWYDTAFLNCWAMPYSNLCLGIFLGDIPRWDILPPSLLHLRPILVVTRYTTLFESVVYTTV